MSEHDESITAWQAQLRKGAAELAVLSLLRSGEKYGIELLDALSGADGLGISDGTIYPLLKRLERDGRIEARWQQSVTGPPRKYYKLSSDGEAVLAAMKIAWREFRGQLDRITGHDEQGD